MQSWDETARFNNLLARLIILLVRRPPHLLLRPWASLQLAPTKFTHGCDITYCHTIIVCWVQNLETYSKLLKLVPANSGDLEKIMGYMYTGVKACVALSKQLRPLTVFTTVHTQSTPLCTHKPQPHPGE